MKYQTLQILRPCISKNITQDWGENRACMRQNGSIFGVAKGKKCPGLSFYQSVGMKAHNGVDIAGLNGADIYHAATFNGWWKSEKDLSGGLGVDVVSYEPLFFKGNIPAEIKNTAIPHVQNGVEGFLHYVKMRYWHLSTVLGHEKKHITVGTTVGLMGNTGASSGTHLHFAPKWCLADGRGVGSNNGYYGAFDPRPFYKHNATAQEHADMLRLPVVPLSVNERQDMLAQLGILKTFLLELQKLIYKL